MENGGIHHVEVLALGGSWVTKKEGTPNAIQVPRQNRQL
jgi:hypothetical protein